MMHVSAVQDASGSTTTPELFQSCVLTFGPFFIFTLTKKSYEYKLRSQRNVL